VELDRAGGRHGTLVVYLECAQMIEAINKMDGLATMEGQCALLS
jgi:hypothetical protein